MNHKQCLERQLRAARGFTEQLLADFHEPSQWTHQVHEGANHALWFTGHMGVSDNFFISSIAPDRVRAIPGYFEKFGLGSQPSSDPADYPPPKEVLAYMRERRETLLELLAGLSDAELSTPTPKGFPDFMPDYAGVFQTAIWHEGLHSGQISLARRALGHAPVLNPTAASRD